MAKVPFSKLQAAINSNEVQNFYCNKAGEKIYYNVKQYLPLKDKIELISRIINLSMDDNGFYNPMRVKFNITMEVIYTYTNLSFTEKAKEDEFKLYDILISTGIFNDVIKSIPEDEWNEIQNNVWTTIDNVYKYNSSVMGILERVANDYDNLNLDATVIQEKLSDPNNMNLLRDVLSKLG